MAKIVIAGRANCPYLAKIELIGDRLSKNLPDFKLHKILKTEEEWEPWLNNTCTDKGWNHKTSPIIWRELIDRGGKAVLIGGANEFLEYVMGYYGIQSDMTSHDMQLVAKENKETKAELDEEERAFKALSKPHILCMTNAASNVCYQLINLLSCGKVFGDKTEILIRLYDSEEQQDSLRGVQMEANDLNCGLLNDIEVTSDIHTAFKDCNTILILDEIEKEDEESQESWLKRNAEVFSNYAKVFNEVAGKNVQVLVAGNGPLNFNATLMIRNAPKIPRQNIVAVSRIIENKAKSVLGTRLNVNAACVVDLVVWGNLGGKNYIDVSKARVRGYDGAIWGPDFYTVSAVEMVHDNKWLETEYLDLIKKRQECVETALGRGVTLSTATAIMTTLKHWVNGSPQGEILSLAVCSEGLYDVPNGLVFSYPVTMHPKGYFNVVQDFELPDSVKTTLKEIVQDLNEQLDVLIEKPEPTEEEKLDEETDQIETNADNKGDSETALISDNKDVKEDNTKGNEENKEENEESDKKESNEETDKKENDDNKEQSEENKVEGDTSSVKEDAENEQNKENNENIDNNEDNKIEDDSKGDTKVPADSEEKKVKEDNRLTEDSKEQD